MSRIKIRKINAMIELMKETLVKIKLYKIN